jgi:hypothetical protein
MGCPYKSNIRNEVYAHLSKIITHVQKLCPVDYASVNWKIRYLSDEEIQAFRVASLEEDFIGISHLVFANSIEGK